MGGEASSTEGRHGVPRLPLAAQIHALSLHGPGLPHPRGLALWRHRSAAPGEFGSVVLTVCARTQFWFCVSLRCSGTKVELPTSSAASDYPDSTGLAPTPAPATPAASAVPPGERLRGCHISWGFQPGGPDDHSLPARGSTSRYGFCRQGRWRGAASEMLCAV